MKDFILTKLGLALMVLGIMVPFDSTLAQSTSRRQANDTRDVSVEPEELPPPIPWPTVPSINAPENELPSNNSHRRAFRSRVRRPPRPRLEKIEDDRSLRMERIQEKLDRLKKLAKTRQKKTASAPPKPIATTEPSPLLEPLDVFPAEGQADATAAPTTNPPADEPAAPGTDEPAPIPIHLTSTVDSLALANSLFAQGKIDVSAPIYEKLIRQPQKPADKTWIQYQLASCYRMQGKVKEATKLYRTVASAKEDEYWKRRAHWWLDYLGRSQKIYERHAQIRQRLETLGKEVDELAKP